MSRAKLKKKSIYFHSDFQLVAYKPYPDTFNYRDKNYKSLPTCMALGHESYPWSSRQNYKADMEIIILPRGHGGQDCQASKWQRRKQTQNSRAHSKPLCIRADHSRSQGPQVQNSQPNPVSPMSDITLWGSFSNTQRLFLPQGLCTGGSCPWLAPLFHLGLCSDVTSSERTSLTTPL